MAAEPPVATRNRSFSDQYSMSDFRSTHASTKQLSTSFSATGAERTRALEKAPIQFSTMINEIEHVRSRFASEKSNNDQFSSQLRMVSQQIESLTNQQSSMIEFHIGRMDTMLKELKSSGDIAKEQQRAAFEAQQRAKFEREECERREKLERERIERGRNEREQRAKFEQEQRERIEREERDRREMMENLEREQRQQREQREHHEKMQTLQQTSLPSMNLSDIIPQPSRTVTASKRKLSLDLGTSRVSQQADNKRAKVDANGSSDDFNSLFQQFMNKETEKQVDHSSSDANNAPESTNANGTETPMEDSELPVDDDSSSGPADMDTSPPSMQPQSDLPVDIHEALKQQAMAMLQAQLDAGTSSSASPPLDMDLPPLDHGMPPSSAQLSAIVKPEPAAKPPQQPAPPAAYQNHLSSSSSSVPAAVIKSEQKVVQPPPKGSAKKSAGGSKKAKKEVIPAVEDTTIADPMSVPLKNKAIHQWMSKDPERLYTADDICKAGIRYRTRRSNISRGIQKGKVYFLDRFDVRSCLNNPSSKAFWSWFERGAERGWKCKL